MRPQYLLPAALIAALGGCATGGPGSSFTGNLPEGVVALRALKMD